MCGECYLVHTYQNVVMLYLDPTPPQRTGKTDDDSERLLFNIRLLTKQIQYLERRVTQDRISGLSSLALAMLFVSFAGFGLLMQRLLFAVLCAIVATAMFGIGILALKSSAKLRSLLHKQVGQRELLRRQMSRQAPKFF
ncbi:MAG: hypothetical protein RMM17_05845 [Acidobacteriota bacterium]|nr:hypothetical protein [Blastocatellia bacterium]MDW8412189.1 hypothetical protein [Acidobacteriota bacterium]